MQLEPKDLYEKLEFDKILDLVEAELLDSSKLIVPKVKYLPT